MSLVLRAGTELKHRQNLGTGIDGHPQPEDLCGTAQPGSQFIQLQVREVQMAEGAFVQDLRVLASTSQPPRDGGLQKTRSAAEGSSPSASADRTIATC